MCSTIYFIYISNRFVKNDKFFPPYIKRIEISNTVCILCLILQIKNKIVLATRILFFYCFFCVSRFTWYLQAYWIMSNWLNWFWKPTELYFFLWILSLVVKSHLFQFTFVLFLTGFFPVDIFDRYEMQMIQFKKKNGKIMDSFAFVHFFVMSHFIDINLYIIIFCYTFARNR